MNQWIRWKGLIPFIVIVTALALFFLLFIDGLVKALIEDTGTKLVGARVEARNVDVHLSPLGITIDGLQVTNPEQPMSNAVEIQQVRFGLAGDRLLLGKVIIEQMEVEQLRFDTPRKSSGAIKKPAPERQPAKASAKSPSPAGKEEKKTKPAPATAKADKGSMEMPSLALPDVDDILAREPLQTQQQAEALESSLKQAEQQWQQLQKSLPDEKRINSYQKRIDKLARTDSRNIRKLAAAVKELQALRSDLQTDLGKVNKARSQVQGSMASLEKDYKALLQAPEKDKQALLGKYTPDARGIGNLSQLLFGNEASQYVRQGLYWYDKLAPMLTGDEAEAAEEEPERMAGEDIRFAEHHPSPDFLIRRIHASVASKQGDFDGQVLDITHQPEIIRRPVSINFSGDKMRGMESLRLTGKLDHIDSAKSLDIVQLDIRSYKVARHELSREPGLQLAIAGARSDTRLQLVHDKGQLNGQMNIHLRDVKYDNRAGEGEFQQLLVNAFNQVEDFNIRSTLSGSLRQPQLNISSDLDQRLNKQIATAFNRRIDSYKKELEQRVQQAADEQIAPVKQRMEQLRSDIDQRLKQAERQLAAGRAELEKRIRQHQARIDAEKRKAEEAAKQQLQQKANDLLQQLQR